MAKQGVVNDNNNLNDLDNKQMAEYIHWEHRCHLSAQNNQKLDDHVGELLENLGLDHDPTIKEFKGERSDDTMPPEIYTSYLKRTFYGDESNLLIIKHF